MKWMPIYLAIFILASCTNRDVYDSLQANNRNECMKLPQSQYDDCMADANKSYAEYEQERKEAIGD